MLFFQLFSFNSSSARIRRPWCFRNERRHDDTLSRQDDFTLIDITHWWFLHLRLFRYYMVPKILPLHTAISLYSLILHTMMPESRRISSPLQVDDDAHNSRRCRRWWFSHIFLAVFSAAMPIIAILIFQHAAITSSFMIAEEQHACAAAFAISIYASARRRRFHYGALFRRRCWATMHDELFTMPFTLNFAVAYYGKHRLPSALPSSSLWGRLCIALMRGRFLNLFLTPSYFSHSIIFPLRPHWLYAATWARH